MIFSTNSLPMWMMKSFWMMNKNMYNENIHFPVSFHLFSFPCVSRSSIRDVHEFQSNLRVYGVHVCTRMCMCQTSKPQWALRSVFSQCKPSDRCAECQLTHELENTRISLQSKSIWKFHIGCMIQWIKRNELWKRIKSIEHRHFRAIWTHHQQQCSRFCLFSGKSISLYWIGWLEHNFPIVQKFIRVSIFFSNTSTYDIQIKIHVNLQWIRREQNCSWFQTYSMCSCIDGAYWKNRRARSVVEVMSVSESEMGRSKDVCRIYHLSHRCRLQKCNIFRTWFFHEITGNCRYFVAVFHRTQCTIYRRCWT